MQVLSFGTLVQQLTAQVMTAGQSDLVRRWTRECIEVLRGKTWPWNWTRTELLTKAPVVETAGAFTWVVGQQYITCAAPMVVLFAGSDYTGRIVRLGSENYRVISLGVIPGGAVSSSRIYLDRPCSESGSGTLSFYRAEWAALTSTVRHVSYAKSKLNVVRWASANASHYYWRDMLNFAPGSPSEYVPDEYNHLPRPAFPPVVVSAGSGVLSAGTYEYFYTYYDAESGLESPPSPRTTYINSDGFAASVSYGNSSGGDQLELGTYPMRLYRCRVNPASSDVPFYRIQERPYVVLSAHTDSKTTNQLRGLKRYWNGPQTKVCLFPTPAEIKPLAIEHLNNAAHGWEDEDQVDMGVDGDYLELLRLYLTAMQACASRDPNQARQAIVHFNSQLGWRLANRSTGASADVPLDQDRPGVSGGLPSSLQFSTGNLTTMVRM